MISYPVYKIIHILTIVVFFSLSAVSLMGEASKTVKWLTGISGFLIMVAGMGLLARIGVGHGESFPLWIWGKFIIWGVLMAGIPIIAKRANTQWKAVALFFSFVLLYLAHYLAIYKVG